MSARIPHVCWEGQWRGCVLREARAQLPPARTGKFERMATLPTVARVHALDAHALDAEIESLLGSQWERNRELRGQGPSRGV